MHFDLVDLRLLVNIAEQSSFTRGAELSSLSVPAASNRIKHLEGRIGIELLYRTSSGVTLTPAGEAFLQHGRLVLAQLEQLRGDLQAYTSGIKGSIRIFATTTAVTELLPATLSRFLASHPDVNITLQEHRSQRIVQAVRDGAIDIGIVAEKLEGTDLQAFPYGHDKLILIAPEAHPLAMHSSLSFSETLDHDYVGLSESSAMHSFMSEVSRVQSRPIRFRIEVGSIEAACRMVALGVGLALVPESAAIRYANTLGIRVIPLNDAWSQRTLQLCVRDLAALPLFARDLVHMLANKQA